MTPEELAEIKAHYATGVDADVIQRLAAEVERLTVEVGVTEIQRHIVDELLQKQARIDATLAIAYRYGGIDGEHHKEWVIDQMVRQLTGDYYAKWREHYDNADDGLKWPKGIAP